MKTRSCFSNSDFSCNTASCLIRQRVGFNRRLKTFLTKLINRSQGMLFNVSAMIFTGTVFLGGSYLFFVQLAEYGW